MDIQKLIDNYRAYFWSKNNDTYICGGYVSGRNYGTIEISIIDEKAVVQKTCRDGMASSMLLAPEEYSSYTNEYRLIKMLILTVNGYLAQQETTFYQEVNREKLMRQVAELLPVYDSL